MSDYNSDTKLSLHKLVIDSQNTIRQRSTNQFFGETAWSEKGTPSGENRFQFDWTFVKKSTFDDLFFNRMKIVLTFRAKS